MNRTVRRAGAYSAVGALALPAPLLGRAAVLPFLVVAALALVVTDGPLFDLFARPVDRSYGRLRSLFDFSLAATVLGGLAVFGGLPLELFVGTVLLVAVGNLGAEIVRSRQAFAPSLGFLAGGLVGATAGILASVALAGGTIEPGAILLYATTGTLLGGLVRSMLFPRDEPPVVLSIGLVLWFLAVVGAGDDPAAVATALLVVTVVGLVSWLLDTATIEGVLAGVLLSLLTIVLGDWTWFVLLLTFFAVGGIATKFRYEIKVERDVAEPNDGSRGGENVLANSLVALGAVFLGAAIAAEAGPPAIAGALPADSRVAWFLFAGALATALGDTLSSEIGAAYDGTRLITTLEPVPPGTDGAVTWQGWLAGVAGALVIALLSLLLFPVSALAAVVVTVGGVVGMTVDSLLGATLEGDHLGNASVNFVATLAGGVAAVLCATLAGVLSAGVAVA